MMLIILIMLGSIWELNCTQLFWAFYLLDSIPPPLRRMKGFNEMGCVKYATIGTSRM